MIKHHDVSTQTQTIRLV